MSGCTSFRPPPVQIRQNRDYSIFIYTEQFSKDFLRIIHRCSREEIYCVIV